jgi:antitoxin (DNA-binding transcriptional repressor) of toxin-antitoxin stability system
MTPENNPGSSGGYTTEQAHQRGERHDRNDARTFPVTAVQSKLPELLAGMAGGEELILTADGVPVAVIKRLERTSWPSVPGTAKDRPFWMSPDFDAPLEDFAEYME